MVINLNTNAIILIIKVAEVILNERKINSNENMKEIIIFLKLENKSHNVKYILIYKK